ncbi:hypothetical protein LDENG_00219470 [Lucifuga dentata]|nr:hypothetical protein LDENG_00219470 [Lucifuga dentata]
MGARGPEIRNEEPPVFAPCCQVAAEVVMAYCVGTGKVGALPSHSIQVQLTNVQLGMIHQEWWKEKGSYYSNKGQRLEVRCLGKCVPCAAQGSQPTEPTSAAAETPHQHLTWWKSLDGMMPKPLNISPQCLRLQKIMLGPPYGGHKGPHGENSQPDTRTNLSSFCGCHEDMAMKSWEET